MQPGIEAVHSVRLVKVSPMGFSILPGRSGFRRWRLCAGSKIGSSNGVAGDRSVSMTMVPVSCLLAVAFEAMKPKSTVRFERASGASPFTASGLSAGLVSATGSLLPLPSVTGSLRTLLPTKITPLSSSSSVQHLRRRRQRCWRSQARERLPQCRYRRSGC